jgi:conjugal transfer mating pair stabilization protein TraN
MRVLYFILLCSCNAFASDLNKAYEEGNHVAKSHYNQSIDLLKTLDVSKFPGFEPNLSQENYYQGTTQTGNPLEADAQKPTNFNEAIKESFNQRPSQKIDNQSEDMKRIHQISDEMVQGQKGFCLDGSCSNHDYEAAKDEDFKKGISALSSAAEASKNFNASSGYIFKGQLMECSNDIAGIKNCCRDTGWGIDLNLVHCTDHEKNLGLAKQNNRVVATGEYCYKRKKLPVGSVCVSRHKTYCVFQSKLARIVQEQGRRNQLNINFGWGQYSNCQGITPAQMQSIHFEGIDFSEVYQDIQNKQNQPDVDQATAKMSERFKDYYQQGEANG